MSLAIDVDKVNGVLLADGWHTVRDNSFGLDAYEYLWYHSSDPDRDPMVMLGGGQEKLLPSTGFSFIEDTGRRLSGPLTSVLAVTSDA